uniref:Uncharacterized protein n=1 Tax=Anguilla anguilla TaxID=7936 RepID=A0A0E9PDP7_ANGAN
MYTSIFVFGTFHNVAEYSIVLSVFGHAVSWTKYH